MIPRRNFHSWLECANPYADETANLARLSRTTGLQAYFPRLDLSGGGVPDRPNVEIESGSEVFQA